MTRVLYDIVLRGRVGSTLSTALDGFELVSTGEGETRFRGVVADQPALHCAFDQISAFGLEIKSVTAVESVV